MPHSVAPQEVSTVVVCQLACCTPAGMLYASWHVVRQVYAAHACVGWPESARHASVTLRVHTAACDGTQNVVQGWGSRTRSRRPTKLALAGRWVTASLSVSRL